MLSTMTVSVVSERRLTSNMDSKTLAQSTLNCTFPTGYPSRNAYKFRSFANLGKRCRAPGSCKGRGLRSLPAQGTLVPGTIPARVSGRDGTLGLPLPARRLVATSPFQESRKKEQQGWAGDSHRGTLTTPQASRQERISEVAERGPTGRGGAHRNPVEPLERQASRWQVLVKGARWPSGKRWWRNNKHPARAVKVDASEP